ncbi:asparagine synthase (glutamine-hydrolyzing) [Agrobacterium tumefaciens]|uniref:asparagine synthase (glutamine-hydrolyzing) n=1 Tax=Agrobacterium tumefaciens TaxID=358 RepID=A0AA44JBI2_AGRTU|nr:asparagine synthase (glutamine-hydrolyzing) [Agrobacterium tumefaciens]NTB87743.1 asparagine synthase (glutamine-hydrolyzing) [Agrobacterium tumefaciens]NTC32034.1 asparagine synthase (glutamine-hydrolyzing) [Agrobacterium tumefaciens]
MCGIAGFVGCNPVAEAGEKIREMAMTLEHRGPDHQASWVERETNAVALGHARLAVIDPTSRSHQPMFSKSGRFVVAYNGEIYNHREIRALLVDGGANFSTTSDTEVLTEAISAWGVERTVSLIQGMFAFAAWDTVYRKLWLCRDRLGIKPCYWMWKGGTLVFGSQPKALLKWDKDPLKLNKAAVKSLLDRGFIASPHSIFANIRQLEPGQMLSVKLGEEPTVKSYWELRTAKHRSLAGHSVRSEDQMKGDLDELLNDAVERYMRSDVPTGCFLSGGYDSSLVAAIATRHTSQRLKTFAVGFEERGWDESWKAREIAHHLGSEHYELIFSGRNALEIIPDIPTYYDEPFADFSQIPTLALSRLAREHVTVSLSGDGGDELFGGYDRYGWSQIFWNVVSSMPADISQKLLSFLQHDQISFKRSASIPPVIEHAIHELSKHLPLGRPISKFKDLYDRIMSTGCGSLFEGAIDAAWSEDPFWEDSDNFLTLTDRMQLQDLRRYMGDGILTKVDRASMSVGLEVRVPLLSEQVVDFAFGLPESARYRGDSQRDLQKELCYQYVPRKLLEFPKMGFGFPLDEWLRTYLRDWAEDLLSLESLEGIPYLKLRSVRALWLAHSSRASDEHWRLWPVLMYVQWHRKWRDHIAD